MNSPIEHALGKSAVSTADDAFPANQLRKAHQALRNQPWMLDDVGGVSDHAGQKHTFRRQLRLLPDLPLVLMAWIGHFQGITTNLHAKDKIDDIFGRDVVGVRTVPAAPTDMIAALRFRNAFQRAIKRRDFLLGPA